MKDENIYYVYEHWRPDKNVCFYVGKGKLKRAWDLSKTARRNDYHKAVTSKLISMGLTLDVRIVFSGLSNEEAYCLEIERIAFYGKENLTNMTAGGDGLYDPTGEVREKISKSQKGRKPDLVHMAKLAEINRGKKYCLGKKASPEAKAKMSASRIGNKYALGTKWKEEYRAKASAERKIRGCKPSKECSEKSLALCRKKVVCLTDGKVFDSAADAGRFYGLYNHSKIAEVCRGTRHHTKGRIFRYVQKDVA